jgi:hypothetical protein
MTPNHQIKPAGNDFFHDTGLLRGAQSEPLELVLVEYQNVEPTLIDLAVTIDGSFELDLSAFKRNIQPFIFHVADAKEGNTGTTFREQNWLHRELLNICDLAEVVYVVVATELVK